MNAIAETLPGTPSGTGNPLDGVEAEMDKRRRESMELIRKASSELGDEPEYYVTYGDLNPQFASDFYQQSQAEDIASIKKYLLLMAASGLAVLLDALYVRSALSGDAATSSSTGTAIVLIPVLAMISFGFLLAAIFKTFFDWGSKADFVELFGDKAAETWGVGSKAIYAVSKGNLQVVRLDAVGSVELQEDGRLVVSSRFGDSSVSFREARAGKMSADEVAEDIRHRIR
jgi:hypothetical protein